MPTRMSKIQGQPISTGCPFFVARKLTGRELEVLNLAALGLTSKGIARRLSIAEVTVKKHRQAACEALGAANITNAVARAIQQGLIKFNANTAH